MTNNHFVMKQQVFDLPPMSLDKIVGLTDAEAKERLLKFGRNYVAEKRPHIIINGVRIKQVVIKYRILKYTYLIEIIRNGD